MARTYHHTPEPWHVDGGSVYDKDDRPIAHMERDHEKAQGIPPVERDSNAHRIAECVTALEGVPDPAAFMAAMDKLLTGMNHRVYPNWMKNAIGPFGTLHDLRGSP